MLNKRKKNYISGVVLLLFSFSALYILAENYKVNEPGETIETRFPPPAGFERVPARKNSFAEFLRKLPLKKHGSKVHLYDGSLMMFQDGHSAVLDIDIGSKNLQQCADLIIRLRAEYLWKMKRFSELHFNFTSGDRCSWDKWKQGWRPIVRKNKVKWAQSAAKDSSKRNFYKWLDMIYMYAGTHSLYRELNAVNDITDMKIGDIFIIGAEPMLCGHATLVVDMAVNLKTGKKVFMLAQGDLPAQNMYIVKYHTKEDMNPWYPLDFGEELYMPYYGFRKTDLHRFPKQ